MTDPRIERSKLYPLEEILFVVLCGSICGAESWRDFVSFGEEKLDFLREYFPFRSGIPCKNTFARVCGVLDPEKFRECFIAWTMSLQTVPAEVITPKGAATHAEYLRRFALAQALFCPAFIRRLSKSHLTTVYLLATYNPPRVA